MSVEKKRRFGITRLEERIAPGTMMVGYGGEKKKHHEKKHHHHEKKHHVKKY